jgi:hypothetical protein
VPGRVFKGQECLILDAIASGQMQATGTLADYGAETNGRALAVIDVKEDLSGYQIPVGAAAQVAVYTEHWHELSLLRKILLRMRSWENAYSWKGMEAEGKEVIEDLDRRRGCCGRQLEQRRQICARLGDRPSPWRSSWRAIV